MKTHLQRVYEKLGVSDRAAAVAEAMRRGVLDGPGRPLGSGIQKSTVVPSPGAPQPEAPAGRLARSRMETSPM